MWDYFDFLFHGELFMRTIKSLSFLCVLSLWFSAAASANTPTLSPTGATNVEVGNNLYNVEFKDGSCISIVQFSGCDQTSDFFNPYSGFASDASDALLALFNSPGNEVYTKAFLEKPESLGIPKTV